jgi:glycosyltransferase involved in cell wall biosynthesis
VKLPEGASGSRSRRATLMGPWPPPAGGVASHMVDLREFLRSRGIETVVLAETRRASQPGVVRFDPRRRALPILGAQLVHVPVAGGILHCHGSLIAYPTAPPLLLLRSIVRARRIRWIETLHDQTLVERFPLWPIKRRRLLAQSLREAYRVLAVGRALTDFAEALGVDTSRLVTTTPLISTELELGELASPLDQFSQNHWPLLLGVGAPTPAYDLETFLLAFDEFRVRHPNAGLLLASTSFSRDPVYAGRLRAHLSRLEPSALMVVDLPRPQMLRLASRSSVVLRGPISESFGMVRAEAALLMKPVVGTATGFNEFTVGYVHGDPASLHDALVSVLDHGASPNLGRASEYVRKLARETQQGILRAYGEA